MVRATRVDDIQTPPSGTDSASPPEGQPPAEGQPGQNGTPPVTLTAEEVESQWKHRVSQKDRAHAAAEQALRDENDALRRRLDASTAPRSQSSGQPSSGGNDPAVEALRQELDEQRKATEAERAARVIEQRKAKYPALARGVGDAGNSIFSTADEATLAKLNAQYDDGSSTGTFAPTSPRRAAQVPAKTLGDMNKAELEAELRRSVERGDLKRPE
jgi:hypothetical protein